MPGKTKNIIAAQKRKSGTIQRRREKEHQRRLVALGIPAGQLVKMNSKSKRALLHKLSALEQKKKVC